MQGYGLFLVGERTKRGRDKRDRRDKGGFLIFLDSSKIKKRREG
jgi:hypothetical protein